MINSTENIASLLFLGFAIFAFFLVFTFNNMIYTQTTGTIENMTTIANVSNSTIYQNVKTAHTDVWNILTDGFRFIIYILAGMTIYSSFTQRNTITSYVFSFILSVMVGALAVFLMVHFYNTFIVASSGLLDLTSFPYFFFDNFAALVLANIVAGILSFIFIQRGWGE